MQAIVPLVGLGVGLWGASQMAKSQQSSYEKALAQMQSTAATNIETMPATPENPTLPGAENTEAENAAQQAIAAAAQQQAMYNPTSGLGITGSSLGKRRTLAGV